ncbi:MULTISPECIES: hypothetical protein [unclassified Streptomyces]|uniref:hypothetical protein n=1 Tax=unclassified Streptomyces TaxID=2593676 RepID=UPI003819319E
MGTVRPFLGLLVTVVDFGATPEGLPVLEALDMLGRYSCQLPDLPGDLRPWREPDATDEG